MLPQPMGFAGFYRRGQACRKMGKESLGARWRFDHKLCWVLVVDSMNGAARCWCLVGCLIVVKRALAHSVFIRFQSVFAKDELSPHNF